MSEAKAAAVWHKITTEIKSRMSPRAFSTWIQPLSPLSLEDNSLVVSAPEYIKEWVEDRYLEELSVILKTVTQKPCTLYLSILENTRQRPLAADETEILNVKENIPVISEEEPANKLNKKYSFSSFVVGNSNRLAYNAALAVSDAPSRAYNPFFLYGGVGLGKTHLMQAIAQKIKDSWPDKQILYISCEKFTNEFINSIRSGNMESFRQKYRSIDCLLVDDIQFLAKKEGTQEEFFHTFNTLYNSGKQIVIASDCLPKEIPTLEERLRSRFAQDLMADVQPPDLETRIAILRKKFPVEELLIPNEVFSFVASKITNNVRELEGALRTVIAFASFNENAPITLDLTIKALKDVINTDSYKPLSIEIIQEETANFYKIKKEELLAKNRKRNVVKPRQIAMYLCRELTDCSYPKIGELFGAIHYSTVIHSIQKIAQDMEKDPSLKNDISILTQKFTV